MEHEYHHYDFGKHAHHAHGVAADRHSHEDAEDVERQQGYDGLAYGERYYLLPLRGGTLQHRRLAVGYAQSCHESEDEGTHDIGHRGYLHREIGREDGVETYSRQRFAAGDKTRKESFAGAVAHECRHDGVKICHKHSDNEQASGTLADVGDGWSDESDDDEWDEEAKELAEDAVEGGEHTEPLSRHKTACHHAKDDGNDDAGQQGEVQKACFPSLVLHIFHKCRLLG